MRLGRRRAGQILRATGIYASVCLLTVFSLFPFVWMIFSSLKPPDEIYTTPPRWLSNNLTVEHYRKVFFETNIPRYFLNSTMLAFVTTVTALALAILAGYGFARFKFPGSHFMSLSVLFSQMLPQAVVLIPLYIVLNKTRLINTYPGLTITYLMLTLPLSVWMLKGFFTNIPRELEESAMIDGCSRSYALFKVIVPISAPAILATGIYIFTVAWQEFMFALNFATTLSTKTLPIGISEFTGQFRTDWGGVMAASVVVTVPVVVLFIAFHKYFVQGITEGAMKG